MKVLIDDVIVTNTSSGKRHYGPHFFSFMPSPGERISIPSEGQGLIVEYIEHAAEGKYINWNKYPTGVRIEELDTAGDELQSRTMLYAKRP